MILITKLTSFHCAPTLYTEYRVPVVASHLQFSVRYIFNETLRVSSRQRELMVLINRLIEVSNIKEFYNDTVINIPEYIFPPHTVGLIGFQPSVSGNFNMLSDFCCISDTVRNLFIWPFFFPSQPQLSNKASCLSLCHCHITQ